MEFSVECSSPERQHTGCVVVGVFEPRRLSPTAEQFDSLSGGHISALLHNGDLEGKIGQTLLLHRPQRLSERLLLVGCGKQDELNEQRYQEIIETIVKRLSDTGTSEALCFFDDLPVKTRNIYWKIRQAIEVTSSTFYQFDKLKHDKPKRCRALCKLIFNVAMDSDLALGRQAVQHGVAIASGLQIAKDLGNMPPNLCNAAYLSEQARQLAITFSQQVSTTVVDSQQMQSLGMNAYLAVGQGSQNESLMSIITYKGAVSADAKPIVLVGKGLTFDAGGISLKPGLAMDEMKYDMCGAAAVLGIMRALAELQLPLNVIGVLAGCENMPGGKAYRPGDILTTLSGQTVEVLNTDAEGRLVLCDVLTYVERFNPEVVIDIATLTGACVVALGHHLSGLMSNHHPLADELLNAAQQSSDSLWRLPLDERYQEQLDSNFADMANIGDRSAGAIVAGCFLSRFTRQYHWAHLDVAGTAWRSGKAKGATGRPVALLIQFLLNRVGITSAESYTAA